MRPGIGEDGRPVSAVAAVAAAVHHYRHGCPDSCAAIADEDWRLAVAALDAAEPIIRAEERAAMAPSVLTGPLPELSGAGVT